LVSVSWGRKGAHGTPSGTSKARVAWWVIGFFVGVVDSLVPVGDLIGPHGPIGHHVNYAVYKVRDSYTVYALPRRVSR